MRGAHPQRRCARVHAIDKRRDIAKVPLRQHVGVVAGRGQEKALQQLVLGELLTCGYRKHRLILVSFRVKGRDVGRRGRDHGARLADGERVILEHDQRRHHFGGAGHRHRRLAARGPDRTAALLVEGGLPRGGPGQGRRDAQLLRGRSDGDRGDRGQRPEVLEGASRQHQREQVRKGTANE